MKQQVTPVALLNIKWKLLDIGGTPTTCQAGLQFKERGQLEMTFNDIVFKGAFLLDGPKFQHLYSGNNPIIIWEATGCNTDPSYLAMYLNMDNVGWHVRNDSLVLNAGQVMTFRKVIQ